MKSTRLVLAIRLTTLAAIAAPATVFAGGFSLNEQSASAMGVANAGAAANPENASTVFFNPAGMSQLKGTNLSFGVAVLDIDAEAKEGSTSATDFLGNKVNGLGGGDIADLAVLPNFFLTHEVSDSIDVGFGIHAPYGLAADYDDNFSGRYFADKTELTAIAFTPSIAINNGKGLSMGLGMNIMYAEARLTKFQDVRGGFFKSTGGNAAQAEALAKNYEATYGAPYSDINGDDIAVNFRVGFLYELSDRTQFGLTAQTGTEFELKGEAEITNFPSPTLIPMTLREDASVPLAIPESITVGARHQLNESVTVLAGATYARWSRFEGLDVFSTEGDGGQISQALGRTGDKPLSHVTEKWQNTWQFNVGGIWQATPAWAFKAGYAWDESPVGEFVTARVPSSDRHWLTLGTQWKDAQSGWTVDAAVGTLLFTDDPKINEFVYQYDAPSQKDPAAGKSNYKGEYELDAWSASLQISKAF
ncbi:outer membrane protein transport protein [Marinobacter sp. M3C]|uniref:OmpP1/FadL family transporter n=1 Tax=Marinobacter sp. M3C TaxID=2917715 RepID=UPI00200FAD04|nr:outer membrane protein transport protein [Marinobacter sp. M3C]UQG62122.1 outer membrane protein transport protein [Marinobacter sp. M3C]